MKDELSKNKEDLPSGIPVEWRDYIIALRNKIIQLESRINQFEDMVAESISGLASVKQIEDDNNSIERMDPNLCGTMHLDLAGNQMTSGKLNATKSNSIFKPQMDSSGIISKATKIFSKKSVRT